MKKNAHYPQFSIASLLIAILLGGCTTSHVSPSSTETAWMQAARNYSASLEAGHPDQPESLFKISDSMRLKVQTKFAGLSQRRAAQRLATWLISQDGLAMSYDVNANFAPIEAFEQRRGNCLSFTILLSSLAQELGIDIKFNEVDLPDVWDFNEDRNFLLYRHVNGIYHNTRQKIVFDLAIQDYDHSYPQRIITRELAAAKLLSNRGIAALSEDNLVLARHYLKLAISTVPDNSEFWVNYGVILKRGGERQKAEQAFMHGYALGGNRSIAASNLEKLYNHTSSPLYNTAKAKKYARLARSARQTNPYYHFEVAKRNLHTGHLRKAHKSIKRAKRLHKTDPRFYELSSRIFQRQYRYSAAFKELRKAHALSLDRGQRGRYALKALRVNQLAVEQFKQGQNKENSRAITVGDALFEPR